MAPKRPWFRRAGPGAGIGGASGAKPPRAAPLRLGVSDQVKRPVAAEAGRPQPTEPPLAPAAASRPAVPPPARPGRSRSGKGRGRRLIVGRDIRLAGEIKTCEKIVVEGVVEGELSESKSLEIADSGHFKGTAVVEDCIVRGTFDGDLTVRGVLAVRATGSVRGTIRYGEIEIERGGRIAGGVESQEASSALRAAPDPDRGDGPKLASNGPASEPAPAKMPGPRPA